MNKRLLFLYPLVVLVMVILGPIVSLAQTTPQYFNNASGASYNAFPLNSTTSNQVQWCYGPSLFNSSGSTGTPAYFGNITTVYFRLGTTAGSGTYTNFTISLGQNVGTIGTFANSTFITGLTQVFYQASYTTTGASPTSWYAVPLQTPFLYDPSLSLVFEMKVQSGTGNQVAQVSGSGNQRIWAAYGSTSGSAGAGLVDFGFDLVPAGPCTAPPTAGVSTASDTTPCFGVNVQLGLSGNSNGTGQTFQWESATNIAGPYTSFTAPATIPSASITTSAVGTTYYRAAVVCNSQTSYSTPVAITVPAPFPGGTYTINSALPTGSGNFQTFADAAAAINCGISGPVVFNVVPGTYVNDRFALNDVGGTSSTNTITLNGNGDTLYYVASTSADPAAVRLNGTDHVTISNMVINGHSTTTTNYAWGVGLSNGADSNTITGCTIILDSTVTGSNYAGIVISGTTSSPTAAGSGCDGNIITNNTISGGYYGITLMGTSGAGIIEDNQITNNIIRNFYVYGIYSSNTFNTLIQGNDLSRPDRTTVSTFAPIYLPTGGSKLTVNANRIHDNATASPGSSFTMYGVYITASNPSAGNENIISNNAMYNLTGIGTHYGFYNSGSGNIRYYHNSMSFDYAAAASGGVYGLYQTTAASGIEFKNNIVYITKGGSTAKYGLYRNTTTSVITADNNNYYINGPVTASNYVGYWGSNQATLTAWQNASGQDASSVSMDPIFASAGNLTPVNSLLDNLGAPVGITTDINGAARSLTTPDIGAYEFSVPPCGGSPVAGTASITGGIISACPGANLNMTLTGFTIASGIDIQWESSPAGAGVWSPIAGATSSTLNTIFGGPTDYRAMVTCANGGGFDISNTVSVTSNPIYLCYCSPLTGTNLHTTTANYITAVSIPTTTLNSTTSTVGAGGYTQLDYTITSNTATLTQGQTYTLNATITSASYSTELWIDYDQNGTFDASEYTLLTPGTTATATITVPVTAVPGLTGMRLRNAASASTIHTDTGACNVISVGRETEDYVITIAPGIQCTGTPATTGTVAANLTTICNGMTANLSLSSFPTELGLSFQWESSPGGQNNFTAITGANGYNYTTPALSADMDYRVAVTCTNAGGGTAYSNVVNIVVTNPQVTSSTGGTRCGVGTVNLSAATTAGNVINWYANPTGGSPLATNTTNFTTPVIASTTTYYAAANAGGVSGTLGLPNRVGSTTNSGYTDIGLMFDALSPFTLNSVAIYPVGSGGTVTATIQLKSSSGSVLQTTTINVLTSASPGTKTVVPLNFNVPAGNGHRLVFSGASGGGITGFIREVTTGFTFPYTFPGVASITSSYSGGATSSYYYYFYDWQITTGCEGTRVPVTATVTTPPAYAISLTADTVCLGSSTTVSISSANAYSYTWTPGGAGSSITVSPITNTTYYVSGTDANNCAILDSATVYVKSVPATVATIAAQPSICVSGNADLSLSPSPMPGIGIQWQKNTGSGFADIPGANSSTLSDPVTANVSYQAKLFCNSTLVTTSTPVAVTYSNPQLLNTYPGSRCGTGPVTLAAEPAPGVNVKWYDVLTGGTSLGSGNVFTSPSISSSTTYYAEPIAGQGGNDSLGVPLASGTTTGVYFHMFMVSSTTGMTVTSIGIKCNQAVGTLTSWDIYYRPDNYQQVPGANTSSAGWTLLSTVTGVPSMGASAYTTITNSLNLAIPSGATYSFHIAPVGGATHQYATNAMGTVTATNTNASIIAGHRGSLFNCTTTSGQAVVQFKYTLGCVGTRVPVAATINGAASGTGLSTGGTTIATNQADGTTITYTDACNDIVATVDDASGGNVLGNTVAIALTTPIVKTHQGKPFVQRYFEISPASSGAATVTLYALQSEFTAYNNYVTSNSLPLPLLPTGPADITGMNNIVITQYHGAPLAGTAGPLGQYSNTNVSFIPNSAITKTSNGTYWTLTFPVTGFSGFYIHTGASPLAIDLRSISATNAGSRNRIDWMTATEMGGDRFELERSADSRSFTQIASLAAKGQPSSYSYWDEHPVTGVNYYRLRMVDAAGNASYSNTVSATVKAGSFVVEAYPNPVSDVLTVKVYGQRGPNATIVISDVMGKVIRTLPATADRTEVDMTGLANGVYLIRYSDQDQAQTIKVTKQ